MNKQIKAALFDLDGVVFHTEPQYTKFWHDECERYYPGQGYLEKTIKGTTLGQTSPCFSAVTWKRSDPPSPNA